MPDNVLNTDHAHGLTAAEARQRQQQYGPNALEAVVRESWWRMLLRQFRSLIVVVLGAAAAFSFAFQEMAEGYAILAVIVINAAIGFVLEWNAQSSMAALRELGESQARVLRDGQVQAIPSEKVTLGDVLLVEAGEVVAADAHLFDVQQLQVNESALTGESMPVSKQVEETAADAPLAEQTNRLFKGTAVANGTGRAIVSGIGPNTELGTISDLVQEAKHTATPLEAKLDSLAKQLVYVTVGLAVLYVGVGAVQGKSVYQLAKTAIVLAVAAIPEGMSIVATLALAYGMMRLARRNVLVKRLAAVETLGGTDVIFTDKTGTLTQNEMAVQAVWLPEARVEFEPEADPPDHPALAGDDYQWLLRVAALCNNATYHPDKPADSIGDPLEVALLALAHASGFDVAAALQTEERLAEQPFNSDTRLMATLHRAADGGTWLAVKGAAEEVARQCTQAFGPNGPEPLPDDARREWVTRAEELAEAGLRTLSFAYRPEIGPDTPQESWVQELTWLGLVAFLDPPRAEVIPALEDCRAAGIRVIMVTGDHPATALTVARQVHLVTDEAARAMTGADLPDLSQLPAEAEQQRLNETAVFARVSPAQKLELIDLYQQQGHIVAMTGDGVNDAPALKKADIGVAMGLRGTQIAAEAADLVLRDDSFASIVAAVEQGRVIFTNIRRFVLYLVSCNLSEILVVTAAGLLSTGSGLLPLQILFLNLLTDVFPALALGVGRGTHRVMQHPPRDPQAAVMRPADWRLSTAYAVLMTVLVMTSYFAAEHILHLSAAVDNNILFLGLAGAQLLHVFNMADPGTPPGQNDVLRNRYVWLALALCIGLIAVTYFVPLLRELLSLQPMTLPELGLILAPSVAMLVLGQVLGWVLSRWHPANKQPTPRHPAANVSAE